MTSSASLEANDHVRVQSSHGSLPPPTDVPHVNTNSPRCHQDELRESSSPQHAKRGQTTRAATIRMPKLISDLCPVRPSRPPLPQQGQGQKGRDESFRIRSRYLHRLGYSNNPAVASVAVPPVSSSLYKSNPTRHPLLRMGSGSTGSIQSVSSVSSQLSTAPWPVEDMPTPTSATASNVKPASILRRREAASTATTGSNSSSSHSHNHSNGKYHHHVSFPAGHLGDREQVHIIPHWCDYPKDVQNALWMRGDEFGQVVAKNMVEFLAEGYNVDNVLEEDDFISFRGRLVHPAHFMDLE